MQANQQSSEKESALWIGVILVLIVFNGMFSADTYVPSLPHIAEYFGVTPTQVKLTITAYLVSFSLSILFYGPISDRYGRKKVLLFGLIVGMFGGILCFNAQSINALLIGRCVQGAGISVTACLGRSISRDLFGGEKLASLLSYISLGIGIGPILAPLIGGYLQHYFEWHSVFLFLISYTVFSILLVYLYLPETLKEKDHHALHFMQLIKNYLNVIKNQYFMGNAIISSIGMSSVIVYYSLSPFLLQINLGLSAVAYGWLTMLTVFSAVSGRFANIFLVKRFYSENIVAVGTILMLIGGSLMVLFGFVHTLSITTVVMPFMVCVFASGILYPNTSVAALSPFKKGIGVVASVFAGIQTAGALLASIVAAHVSHESQLPMGFILTGLGIIAVIIRFTWAKRIKV